VVVPLGLNNLQGHFSSYFHATTLSRFSLLPPFKIQALLLLKENVSWNNDGNTVQQTQTGKVR